MLSVLQANLLLVLCKLITRWLILKIEHAGLIDVVVGSRFMNYAVYMSLSERSNGLLETYVTWSDIELDMQDALGTVATFGPNKKVTNIGEGNGFASRVCLIDPDWQNGTDDLPKKFVVKIISQLTIVDYSTKVAEGLPLDIEQFNSMEDKMKEMHNVEAKVYELIQKYGRGKIPHTRIYKTRSFDENNSNKGYLIMEFIEGLSPVHVVDNVQPEELDDVLRGLASFERITFEMSDQDKSLFHRKVFGDLMAEIFNEQVNETILNQLEKLAGPDLSEQICRLREIVPELVNQKNMAQLDQVSKTLGMTPVLCHADMWSTNMLWSKNNGKHQVRAIIDYQTAHIGCAAADLGRLFCSLLGGRARQENWERLVEKFYGYVEEEMGDNMPYTLEQLKDSYRRFLPFSCFFVAFMIPSMAEYINQYRKGDGDHEDSINVVHEKLTCLLDDLIQGFETNQKNQMYI